MNDPKPYGHSPEDIRLWSRVLNDDQSAFEEVVHRYQNAVSAVGYSILGNFAWAQEVTQETFWQAWRQRAQLQSPGRLGAWLCGIARNLAHQMARSERRQLSNTLPATIGLANSSAMESSVTVEEQTLVWNALEELPENYREVLVLFYREGQSINEVAEILEISSDAVKQRLSRGREKLRDQLANQIEGVLVRTRPGKASAHKIMVGIAALVTSMKAVGTASAAGIGATVAKTATSSLASAAAKTVVTGASAGIAGGLLGAAGGLGGAWLGTWLPAQAAPTMTERRYLEREGKRTFMIAVGFTLGMVASNLFLFFKWPLAWYLTSVGVITGSFVLFIFIRVFGINRELKRIRESISPDEDPNPSRFAKWVSPQSHPGKSYTSSWTFLGIPLLDIQLAGIEKGMKAEARRAFGWMAIGDHATGVVLAVGGVARGFIALGGVAFGFVALGGIACGVVAAGGCAAGLLAFGGLAVGWHAAGGGAIGYQSAAGGGAIAYHVAIGGGAIAHDYAVGGAALANEANTELAKKIAEDYSFGSILQWIAANQVLFMAFVIILSFLPLIVGRFLNSIKRPQDKNA